MQSDVEFVASAMFVFVITDCLSYNKVEDNLNVQIQQHFEVLKNILFVLRNNTCTISCRNRTTVIPCILKTIHVLVF